MSGRRARLVIKAEDPKDAAYLLGQTKHLLEDRNVEVQIKRLQPTTEEARRVTTSHDEQLDTRVGDRARSTLESENQDRKEDRAKRGVPEHVREAEPPEEVAERQIRWYDKMGGWVSAGWGFTVRMVSRGATDSMLNK